MRKCLPPGYQPPTYLSLHEVGRSLLPGVHVSGGKEETTNIREVDIVPHRPIWRTKKKSGE